MTNPKNEHVFPRKGEWIVKREGSDKNSGLFFNNKKDAMEYAGIIALNDGGSIVVHKYNGQFKDFKHGTEIPAVRTHKIAPIITGTNELIIDNYIEPNLQIAYPF